MDEYCRVAVAAAAVEDSLLVHVPVVVFVITVDAIVAIVFVSAVVLLFRAVLVYIGIPMRVILVVWTVVLLLLLRLVFFLRARAGAADLFVLVVPS